MPNSWMQVGLMAAAGLFACGGENTGTGGEGGASVRNTGEKDSQGSQPGTPVGGQGSSEGIWFEDIASKSGIDFVHSFGPQRFWIPEITGAGVGLFDMEGDGDLDLYALQGGDLLAETPGGTGNRLYANDGTGAFEDVTEKAGVGDRSFGMGCAVGDYDGDGDLDLYVTNIGDNVLYQNQGDGTFKDTTDAAGVAVGLFSTAASFVDFDGDGDLDLFVVNYLKWEPSDEAPCQTNRGDLAYCHPSRYQGPERDVLLRNKGDGTFEDVSSSKGLHKVTGPGLGLVWGQLDDKPGIDFYVANDGMANQLWSGRAGKAFEERALLSGCALSGNGKREAGMGVCLEDFDRNGIWDLVVTHLTGETNTFYLGGRRGFKDATAKTGTTKISQSFTGFGVGVADFDHDGWLDMYVANGRVADMIPYYSQEFPMAEPDQVYHGLPSGRFEELMPRGERGKKP